MFVFFYCIAFLFFSLSFSLNSKKTPLGLILKEGVLNKKNRYEKKISIIQIHQKLYPILKIHYYLESIYSQAINKNERKEEKTYMIIISSDSQDKRRDEIKKKSSCFGWTIKYENEDGSTEPIFFEQVECKNDYQFFSKRALRHGTLYKVTFSINKKKNRDQNKKDFLLFENDSCFFKISIID